MLSIFNQLWINNIILRLVKIWVKKFLTGKIFAQFFKKCQVKDKDKIIKTTIKSKMGSYYWSDLKTSQNELRKKFWNG